MKTTTPHGRILDAALADQGWSLPSRCKETGYDWVRVYRGARRPNPSLSVLQELAAVAGVSLASFVALMEEVE